MSRGPVVLALTCVALATGRAHAEGPIVDRDYAIDFYDGVAIGNTAWVGMGGAGAALIVGSAGALINPSAPAVRPTTDTDTWSWDYHLDYLTGQYSSDYDNNGVATAEDGGAQLITGGLAIRYRNWAGSITVTGQTTPIAIDAVTSELYTADALRIRYMVAKYFPDRDIAVGVGAQQVIFALGTSQESLFQINGGGIVGGITYVPRLRNYRIAGGIESQILGGNVVTNSCDPMNCNGYILPANVVSPVRGIVGFAYRFADTAWNQQVGGIFRDEQSLTLTADVLVTGNSPNAYGIEAFGMQMLQRSGESFAFSARGGVEVEPLPGRLRVRAGSYWEPGRFENVGGRIHGTFGLELRMLEFQAWGRRRGRISFTGDVASRYRNLAFSVGFWH